MHMCVFLGTGHTGKGVLSWRLRGEVMAGGGLASTPLCDQQENNIYGGHNGTDSKLLLQPAAILSSENWPPLIETCMKSGTFCNSLFLLILFFHP